MEKQIIEILRRNFSDYGDIQIFKESALERVAKEISELCKDESDANKVKLTCINCGREFYDDAPKMCCSGKDCGCMRLPIEPIVCSQECYDKIMNNDDTPSQTAVQIIDSFESLTSNLTSQQFSDIQKAMKKYASIHKPEDVSDECCHPYAFVYRKMDYEICNKCGKVLCEG